MTRQQQLFRSLIGEIGLLRKQNRDMARASQGAFRSVELKEGSPTYYDANGVATQVQVDPASGSAVFTPVDPAPPIVPTAPDAIAAPNGIKVVWDGTFDNANWNANVAYVELHRGPENGFQPVDTTQINSFQSFYGGEIFWSSLPEEGEQWFCLITVDRSGNRSAPSGYDSATAVRVIPTTDGDAPAASPSALLRGGIGSLFASWEAINNEDMVTYEVHIAQDDDAFVPVAGDAATLVAETPATSLPIRAMPNGDTLSYDSLYTVRIIAKDADGDAAPGDPSSAMMVAVTAADIAVDYAYVGDLLANQITGGTFNATLLIAGLFRTAISGGRVEIGPFGIRIYDSNGVDINVDLNGVLNRFRGSIEATDIIIRDALQMFGQNNKMGPGSILTLKSSASAPVSSPTLAWEYEDVSTTPGSSLFLTGSWYSIDRSQSSGTEVYVNNSRMLRNGHYYQMPTIVTGDGTVTATWKHFHHSRIAVAAGMGLSVTFAHYNWAGNTGYPAMYVGVWDDAPIEAGGQPILKGYANVGAFSWSKQYWLMPTWAGVSNRFSVAVWDMVTKKITWKVYEYTTVGGLVYLGDSSTAPDGFISTAGWAADEELCGIVYGSAVDLGLEGSGPDFACMVVQTNKFNYVYEMNAWNDVDVRRTDAEWPITFIDQKRPFLSYDPYTVDFGDYYSMNWGAGVDQKVSRYERAQYALGLPSSEKWWGSYAWRGEATKSYKTEDSNKASVVWRKMARLRVTVPDLPAPEAGVGQPRDPDKDPYGWIYYLGRGSTEPINAAMYEQYNEPTMTPGVELATRNAVMDQYPTWSGTNPNVATTFPTGAPAQIQSDDGVYFFDGDGNIKASNLEVETVSGPPFEDTDWVNLVMLNSWVAVGTTAVRKKNGFIFLMGRVQGGAYGTAPIAELPSWAAAPMNGLPFIATTTAAGAVVALAYNSPAELRLIAGPNAANDHFISGFWPAPA